MNLSIADLDWEHDLPEGWTSLSAIAVIKSLDEDGDIRLSIRTTRDVCVWDAAGLLHMALLDVEKQASDYWGDAE